MLFRSRNAIVDAVKTLLDAGSAAAKDAGESGQGVPIVVATRAIKYGDKGDAQVLMAFGPKENFFSNLWRVLGEPARPCEVHFLEPVAAHEDGRRKMADLCRQRIVDVMAAG